MREFLFGNKKNEAEEEERREGVRQKKCKMAREMNRWMKDG